MKRLLRSRPQVLCNRRRRSGIAIVYMTLVLVVLLGATGLAVDMSNLYVKRTQAQLAADAAALAGAIQHLYGNHNGADTSARAVAAENGYPASSGVDIRCGLNLDGNRPYWYQVRLVRQEPLFFMSIFGMRTRPISAYAAAEFQIPAKMGINGNYEYGAVGPVTLSLFGPYGQFQHGDPYSAKYLDNGTPNPLYNENGYNFELSIPQDYKSRNNLANNRNKVIVEIFDPDSYNKGNNSSPQTGQRIDEYHAPTNDVQRMYRPSQPVTTRYKLQYRDRNDPTKYHDIVSASYGQNSATDMQWVTPNGFEIDLNDSRWRDRFWEPDIFRVNAATTAGSNENGYSLRAGPPLPEVTSTRTVGSGYNRRTEYYYDGKWNTSLPSFNPNNGTNISALGKIVLNFTSAGTTNIKLGYVPAGATSVSIDKFDTDVGAVKVSYTDGRRTYTGLLSGNGGWQRDTYELPANYPGGNWSVNYQAGTQDTSTWTMTYTGGNTIGLGSVRLVE